MARVNDYNMMSRNYTPPVFNLLLGIALLFMAGVNLAIGLYAHNGISIINYLCVPFAILVGIWACKTALNKRQRMTWMGKSDLERMR